MTQPNIVFILIDDMGWRDLSCYGSDFYETPNINRLAANGITFTDAYAACPVCSPSRASILSGKYPASVGLTNYIGRPSKGRLLDAPFIDHLPLEEVSLASALRDGGYTTWHVGKWHLGSAPYYPEHQGFDVNIGGCSWGHPHKGYFSPYYIETLPDGPEGEFLTDRITSEAINLIKNHHDGPFFLNLWHYAVHTPIQAKAADIEKYRQKAKAMGLDQVESLVEGEHFPTQNKKDRRVTRRVVQSDPTYAALIDNLDQNIGRLLQAIDEVGQTNNTIIIFTSDNGGLSTAEGSPTCNAPLHEGKGWMYEGGVREPLIVKWPGVIQPGSVTHHPITSPDFYPTLLEAAGLPLRPGQHKDGESFTKVLRGEDAPERSAIYWHYPHYGNQGGTPGSSIRLGDWKLIEFFEGSRLELYNLRNDLAEQHNLVAEEPKVVQNLHKMLVEWRESIEAKIPQPNPDWVE
jgi:arylsulfatase A-like enzyme